MWEGGVRIYGTPRVFNNFPMKDWIKKIIVEEYEKLNKVKIAKKKKKKDAKDVVQKEFCKHSLHASKKIKNKKDTCYIRSWKMEHIFKNLIDHI